MILPGEEFVVNVSIWNTSSDCEEWSDMRTFERGSKRTSTKQAAKALRAMAKFLEDGVELDGEDDEA